MKQYGYTTAEKKLFRKLSTPAKIQDFLNSLPFNFETRGDTCLSPREVVRQGTAHCMEGAMFAAAVLEFHGAKPLLLDLRTTTRPYDYDHVIAVFKQFGCFGAISKTNHGVLRYREPVYKTIRELALSYFHEYFLPSGIKTLREYSDLLDLNHFNSLDWRVTPQQLFDVPEYLDTIKHHKILSSEQVRNLRKADEIEIRMGELVEYQKK
jgi:hypothetical protein